MPIWLYAGNPAPSTDQGPPWPQDRGRPRPGVVLGPEAPPTCLFRLIIWWSGQSAGNLLSKEGRAPQRLHARACGTDSVPPGPLGPRTGPEDQGPPVLGPVGGPRAGCGIVCSRRGWDLGEGLPKTLQTLTIGIGGCGGRQIRTANTEMQTLRIASYTIPPH